MWIVLGRRDVWRVFGVGIALLLVFGVSSASATLRVFIRAPRPITAFAVDGYGRATWEFTPHTQPGCETVYGGVLLAGSSTRLTQSCVPVLDFRGSERIVASVLPGLGLKTIWQSEGVGNEETDWQLWTNTPDGRAVQLGSWRLACGAGEDSACTGTALGPLAARDGTILYGIATFVQVSCGGSLCVKEVGGGVRRVIGGGTPPVLVPGAPAPVKLATACGRFAEQPYAGRQAAPIIQIRTATTGARLATIPITGTLDSIAMSCYVIATITNDASGNHIIRYDARTGALLSSTWAWPTLDRTSIGVFDKRTVYQLRNQVRVYRGDLHRSFLIYRQTRLRPNLTIDENGVRWLRWITLETGTTEIAGINLTKIS
jgi:hypothetical protein